DGPEPRQRRKPPEHRPLDRLNSRGAAGSSVRKIAGAARVRADRDRSARRDVRSLEVRGHTPQGAEVRRARDDGQGVQAMTPVLDPEGAHLAALRRLADFRGRRVLELGCGDGRLTVPVATEAAFVLAFDPDAEAVERARRSLPADLAGRVAYEVASGAEIEIAPTSFDMALFSWSL